MPGYDYEIFAIKHYKLTACFTVEAVLITNVEQNISVMGLNIRPVYLKYTVKKNEFIVVEDNIFSSICSFFRCFTLFNDNE